MSDKQKRILWISGTLTALLLLALANMPYGYYTFLKIATFAGCLYLAATAIADNKHAHVIIYAAIVIMFAPFIEYEFEPEQWVVIDFLSALAISGLAFVPYVMLNRARIIQSLRENPWPAAGVVVLFVVIMIPVLGLNGRSVSVYDYADEATAQAAADAGNAADAAVAAAVGGDIENVTEDTVADVSVTNALAGTTTDAIPTEILPNQTPEETREFLRNYLNDQLNGNAQSLDPWDQEYQRQVTEDTEAKEAAGQASALNAAPKSDTPTAPPLNTGKEPRWWCGTKWCDE